MGMWRWSVSHVLRCAHGDNNKTCLNFASPSRSEPHCNARVGIERGVTDQDQVQSTTDERLGPR